MPVRCRHSISFSLFCLLFPRMGGRRVVLTGQAAEVVVGDAAAQLEGGRQHGAGAGLPLGAHRIPACLYSPPEGQHQAATYQLGIRSTRGQGKREEEPEGKATLPSG